MAVKKEIIDIEAHALFRLLERGEKFGLNYYETKDRAFKTVRLGKMSARKHLSGKYKTYYCYFKDNLAFYVICQKIEFKDYKKYLIKTVIIEYGRQ